MYVFHLLVQLIFAKHICNGIRAEKWRIFALARRYSFLSVQSWCFLSSNRRNEYSKFQFVEQNSVECWCDLGANLVQHFIKRYSRYSRYQTVFLKLQEITEFSLRSNSQRTTAYAVVLSRLPESWGAGGSIWKNSAVLFTFFEKYGIMQVYTSAEKCGQQKEKERAESCFVK